jgi:hypothetical protein
MSAQHKIDPSTRTYPSVHLFLNPSEQHQLDQLKEQYREKYHYLSVDLDVFVSVLISNQLKNKAVPFTSKQLDHLQQQKSLYEQRYQVEFIDLAYFLAHVIENHLKEDKHGQNAKITQLELVNTCQAIGNITDSNCYYSAGLTAKLATLNKPLHDITVGELIEQDTIFNASFNQMMEG